MFKGFLGCALFCVAAFAQHDQHKPHEAFPGPVIDKDMTAAAKAQVSISCGGSVSIGDSDQLVFTVSEATNLEFSICQQGSQYISTTLYTSSYNYLTYRSGYSRCLNTTRAVAAGSFLLNVYTYNGGNVTLTCSKPAPEYVQLISCGFDTYISSNYPVHQFQLDIDSSVTNVVIDTCNPNSSPLEVNVTQQGQTLASSQGSGSCQAGAILNLPVNSAGSLDVFVETMSNNYNYFPVRVRCVNTDCLAQDKSKIGDKHCDGGAYNTRDCAWDGGDCCPYTCQESTCGDMKCKDPSEANGCTSESRIYCAVSSLLG